MATKNHNKQRADKQQPEIRPVRRSTPTWRVFNYQTDPNEDDNVRQIDNLFGFALLTREDVAEWYDKQDCRDGILRDPETGDFEGYARRDTVLPKRTLKQLSRLGNVSGCMYLFLVHNYYLCSNFDHMARKSRDMHELVWNSIGGFLIEYAGPNIDNWAVDMVTPLQNLKSCGLITSYSSHQLEGVSIKLSKRDYIAKGDEPVAVFPLCPNLGFEDDMTYNLMLLLATNDWAVDRPLKLGSAEDVLNNLMPGDLHKLPVSEHYDIKNSAVALLATSVQELNHHLVEVQYDLQQDADGWTLCRKANPVILDAIAASKQ